MKRPSYISSFDWDQMSDEEQRIELAILAEEDAQELGLIAPPALIVPEAPRLRELRQRWRKVPPETVADAFDYDPATGHLYRRERLRCENRRMLPDRVERCPYPAGSVHSTGCLVVRHCGERLYVHRVAWELMTGTAPVGQVRHINGLPFDNRWINLRIE